MGDKELSTGEARRDKRYNWFMMKTTRLAKREIDPVEGDVYPRCIDKDESSGEASDTGARINPLLCYTLPQRNQQKTKKNFIG